MPEPDRRPIADLPAAAASAGLRLRDKLLAILGEDLVSVWVHGGTTFADRPTRPGDLDICAVIANVAPDERTPRMWRRDSASRPNRIYAMSESIAREFDVIFDAMFLVADEVGSGRLPSSAFEKSERVNDWAVCRAHWLAGQYVLLHGRSPEQLVAPPTSAELNRDLDRELEHLERHVYEGDAADQFEATYTILNGCRILRTIETGSPVISKRSAGDWGLANLPMRWHEAIRAAGRSYDGAATAEDNETLRDAMPPFVAMVRQRMPARQRRSGPPRWS